MRWEEDCRDPMPVYAPDRSLLANNLSEEGGDAYTATELLYGTHERGTSMTDEDSDMEEPEGDSRFALYLTFYL